MSSMRRGRGPGCTANQHKKSLMILRSIVLFESARRLLGHDAVLSW